MASWAAAIYRGQYQIGLAANNDAYSPSIIKIGNAILPQLKYMTKTRTTNISQKRIPAGKHRVFMGKTSIGSEIGRRHLVLILPYCEFACILMGIPPVKFPSCRTSSLHGDQKPKV